MQQVDARIKATRPTDWLALAEHVLRAGFVALLFLAVLVPSDTPADLGMFVPQSTGWGLLAMGVSLWLLFGRRPAQWDIVNWLAIGYLLWTAIATFAVWGIGDLRAATNSFFQTAAFVLALLLGRQLLRSGEQRRSVLTGMLALGSAMAVLGLLQYFLFNPRNHDEIRADPKLLLAPLGIADHSSPEAQRAMARALSPEPLGTFTLTNSLACFLTPWIIVLVTALASRLPLGAPAQSPPPGAPGRRSIVTLCGMIALGLLAGCAWVTHSRMSLLALLAGLALLAAVWLRLKGSRYLATGVAVAVAAAVVVAAALIFAGDSGALAAAINSARFRFEYWQSTWAMIRDHWLLGVGPGNFKSVYPQYKLPQASEEIGDPHNFILEIWSTAGTPAVLLLLALLVAVFWTRGTGDRGPETGETVGREAPYFSYSPLTLATLGGAGAAFLAVAIVGPVYVPAYLWILGPVTALCYFALRPLVNDELLRGALPFASATMLINLLAAGGIGFPSVAIPLAFLIGLVSLPRASHAAESQSLTAAVSRPPISVSAAIALFGSVGLYFSCYFLAYLPVMRADAVDDDQRMAADPFSPEACQQVARSELELVESGSPERMRAMDQALDEAIRRDPRSYLSQFWAGDARLRAFRALHRSDLLAAAIDNYVQAAERYPNWSFVHAQLAWARHVAGDDAGAAAAAREALCLDDLCPHEDRKLRQQTLHDTALTPLLILPLDTAMRRLAKQPDAGR